MLIWYYWLCRFWNISAIFYSIVKKKKKFNFSFSVIPISLCWYVSLKVILRSVCRIHQIHFSYERHDEDGSINKQLPTTNFMKRLSHQLFRMVMVGGLFLCCSKWQRDEHFPSRERRRNDSNKYRKIVLQKLRENNKQRLCPHPHDSSLKLSQKGN